MPGSTVSLTALQRPSQTPQHAILVLSRTPPNCDLQPVPHLKVTAHNPHNASHRCPPIFIPSIHHRCCSRCFPSPLVSSQLLLQPTPPAHKPRKLTHRFHSLHFLSSRVLSSLLFQSTSSSSSQVHRPPRCVPCSPRCCWFVLGVLEVL